jgi:DNA polymerase-3 subunit chi
LTEIDFYTNSADRLRVAARLCVKAYGMGMRVRVLTGDAATTARLDQLLWTSPAIGFIPHCRLGSRVVEETPVIVDEAMEHSGPAELLINLHAEQPGFFRRFARLAEIVSADEADLAAGRAKWQYYKQQGYTLRAHKLGAE